MIGFLLILINFVESYPSNRCSSLSGDHYTVCMGYTTNDMDLKHLSDPQALCNDGSSAGYYIRRNSNSGVWVIYVAGGWFCYDEKSCVLRMNQSHTQLMTTSKSLTNKWKGHGLLNEDFHTNPQFWNANHVYIPYCSSDFWLGDTSRRLASGKTIHFRGSHIILSIIKELLPVGLKDASQLILAGSSAGGIGVMQNIDRISEFLQTNHANIDLRGIIDSAWFIDNGVSTNCASSNIYDCHPKLQFEQAIKFWNGVLHKGCSRKVENQPYNCFFSHVVIKNIQTPVFIFQWLYDTVQILVDNKDLESNTHDIFQRKYLAYVSKLGEDTRRSLRESINGKHGVFAPSCISHTALTTTSILNNIELNRSSLNDAITCWLSSSSSAIKKNLNKNSKIKKGKRKCKQRIIDPCKYLTCNKQCPIVYNPMTGDVINLPFYTTAKNIDASDLDQVPFDLSPTDEMYPKDNLEQDIKLIKDFINAISDTEKKINTSKSDSTDR